MFIWISFIKDEFVFILFSYVKTFFSAIIIVYCFVIECRWNGNDIGVNIEYQIGYNDDVCIMSMKMFIYTTFLFIRFFDYKTFILFCSCVITGFGVTYVFHSV